MSVSEYELVLMLDPEESDERRDEIASNARKRIESSGSLKADSTWGMRKLAYEIRQRTEADYRFFRFESGGTPLLDELNHNLRIADGVLRFRLFKVDPRNPVIVPPPPTPLSSGRPERGSRRDGPGGRGRDRGDGYSRGADDEPVAAPVEPVEAAPAPPATEAPAAAEAPSAPAEPTPATESPAAPEAPIAPPEGEPAPAPEAPAEDAAPEAPASPDEQ